MIEKSEKYQHVYESVRALYLVVREAQEERGLPLRRAAVRSNGEVAAEAIDFLCDVELKAKRVLFPTEFNMLKEGLELPIQAKIELGEVFYRCQLGVGGDYKALYYHVKQVMNGQQIKGVEYPKAADPSPSLEEYDRRTL